MRPSDHRVRKSLIVRDYFTGADVNGRVKVLRRWISIACLEVRGLTSMLESSCAALVFRREIPVVSRADGGSDGFDFPPYL